MNIAVQFKGLPRSFKRTYENLQKNIFDTLNPDIFIHTWDLEGSERGDVRTDGPPDEYINLYKPKKFQIERLRHNHVNLGNMVPAFESGYKSNQLRIQYEQETNKKYDVIIFARSDVGLSDKFLPKYAELVKENDIWAHHFDPNTQLIADAFFYTSPKWANISAETYFEINELPNHSPGGERLWSHKLRKENYNFDWIKFYWTNETFFGEERKENNFRFFDTYMIR